MKKIMGKIKVAISLFRKFLLYFFPYATTYWDTFTLCTVNTKPTGIGSYYLDFKRKAEYPGPFDDDGIPLLKRGDNLYYHPTVICQYSLGLFDLLMKKNTYNEVIKQKFLNQIDWLMSNYIEENEGVVWKFYFPVKEYNINPPWISALTQGEAISALCRAYTLTKDEKYILIAEKALKIFQVEVKNGGILNFFNNEPVFEEYPTAKLNFVLNGFIFSLFGLLDLSILNNKDAEILFNKGICSLEKNLKYFDTNFWSLYSLYYFPDKYIASYKYHRIHIEQLKALYHITSINVFMEYADKWAGYQKNIIKKIIALVRKLSSRQFSRNV